MAYFFPRPYIPPVPRSDLEYPTEDVAILYLIAIDKFYRVYYGHWDTKDSFTDKAIYCNAAAPAGIKMGVAVLRHVLPDNDYYSFWLDPSATTADRGIDKKVAGVTTTLGTEAVDIAADQVVPYACIVSGSTLKFYHGAPSDEWFNGVLANLSVSVTDTDLASGRMGIPSFNWIGVNGTGVWNNIPHYIDARLMPSSSALIPALSIVEYDVVQVDDIDIITRKSIKKNVPDMPKNLVGIDVSNLSPDEVEALKSNPKDANGNPLINTLAVKWGAIDYKGEPTMLCAVYGGSPSYLDRDRVLKHIEYARSKGNKVFKPPKNLTEARELHRIIKRDRKEMLIEYEELAYQLIGSEKLEVDAVARFYERELLNLNRIKGVPTWELERTLKRWQKLALKHKRDKAFKIIEKVRRR